MDITLFALLLAAFAVANALSLLCIAIIGGAMALPASAQQRLFRWGVVPALGALVLLEYSVLLGPPPTLRLLRDAAGDVKARGAKVSQALAWPAVAEGADAQPS